jgi:hypothetical protein
VWVASLSSGHVCQYDVSDLLFADGSSATEEGKDDEKAEAKPTGGTMYMCMCVYVCVCIHLYFYVCMYVCTHTHTHTHNIYIYIYIVG